MSLPWIKLYCEILEDPKMGKMSEYLFCRCIKLFLIAGREGKEGLLPPVEDMLWTLRLDEPKLLQTLHELAEVGVTHQADNGRWWIINFAKRQEQSSSVERVRAFRERERKKKQQVTGVTVALVTPSTSTSSSPLPLDSDSSDLNDPRAASIIAQATNSNNAYVRREEKLYQAVTGQMCIPPVQLTQAMTALQALLDHYGANLDRAIAEGREVFGIWCNTTSKAGKPYSKTNTAWLDKWLERIAPRPDKPDMETVAGQLERARQMLESVHR